MFVFVNGSLVPRKEAAVSVFDRGFLLGDGVFETMRAYGGVVFMVERHMQRLLMSATMLGFELPRTRDEIRSAVYETLGANSLGDAYVRVTVSRGVGPPGLDPAPCTEPTLVIMAEPLAVYPAEYYEKGIAAAVVGIERVSPRALDTRVKSLSFLNNVLARAEAASAGAQEAIMLNQGGLLTEGAASNLFFVNDGVLRTPSADCGILEGITREVVIKAAAGAGVELAEGRYTKDDLYAASEVFLTNTSMEVMPVGKVDGVSCAVGDVARRMMKAYKEEVADYAERAK